MASSPSRSKEMQTYAARYNTFTIPHQLIKRRASSQTSGSKKKAAGANAIEWPHEQPNGEDLARAGFFYRPGQDSEDNVQCFNCEVKLDGWEPSDDPIQEHLAHSRSCSWALSFHAGTSAKQGSDDAGDPMSAELVAARKGTFTAGAGWPHEGKKGWKCKVSKMVEAGWCYDPAPSDAADVEGEEEADGVTCFYCTLSLDGWEPKDGPKAEHQRRSPDCAFFALVEKYGGGQKKAAKGRGKKGASRASTASKASSRMSTQSALSTFSQEPSLADIGMGLELGSERGTIDDSLMSTASQATATGTTKGKKKAGRPKAAAKGVKGRKRAGTVDSQVEVEPMYPDLAGQSQSQDVDDEDVRVSSQTLPIEEPASAPAKKGRKGTRQSKQPQADSSVVDVSSMDVSAAPKKSTRGRKAKSKAQPEPEPQPEETADHSDVSAQLQEELERSMDFDAQVELEDTTPQPEELERPKRGAKRTSEGVILKQQTDSLVSSVVVEFPVPPKPATGPKGKRGRQASKQIATEESLPAAHDVSTQEDAVMSEAEAAAPKPTKAKKAPAKGKGGRKASSTRSSRSSKATIIATEPEQPETQEDLERDEREIEAELDRMATEQAALRAEQENVAEFEPSPSHRHTESAVNSEAGSRRQSTKAKASLPPQLPPINFSSKNATPSPTGSDKENQPSSAFAASTKKQPPALVPILSPTKTTRIPLAPGTPNRTLLSPSKRMSPTKQLRQLTSTQPWKPIDLENALSMSPQPTPSTLATRLAGAAGGLTSPEKGLTVEGWVMLQAEKADADLKRKCEEMVGMFEREGVRALGTLQGIVVGGV